MAIFIRPTFTDILNSIQADFNSRLPGTDSTLRRSVINVISYVLAGVAFGLYGFISWISLQIFPDTAESEYLSRWGAIWNVSRTGATQANGSGVATGSVNGTVIPDSTELQRSDGVLFKTVGDVALSTLTATLSIIAEVAGSDGNTNANAPLTFVSPIVGIDSTVTVDSNGLTGGADIQSDPPYEQRLLQRIQKPPQGGDADDYVEWGLSVAGVTRAWCYPKELGIGTVSVRFMMDNTYTDGIPQAGDVTTVQNYINTVRPTTSDVTVVAPVASVLNFTIHLNVDDTADIRASIQANLEDMIKRDAIPAGTIYLSRINEAISLATGEYDHVLTSPNADVTHTTGHIATMGTITWS